MSHINNILNGISPILLFIAKPLLTAVIGVPVGFLIYYFIYYVVTDRKGIKKDILEYIEYANISFDTSISGRTRNILNEKGEIVEDFNTPTYPNIKAIMKWVYYNKSLQRGTKWGFKYDEPFFYSIMAELMDEGRVSPIYDKETDEIVAFKFENFD